jgi:hypothetical protein
VDPLVDPPGGSPAASRPPNRAERPAVTLQLGPIVIPCRACAARPGYGCEGAAKDFHQTRVSDAQLASELIADLEARPAVVRRKAAR